MKDLCQYGNRPEDEWEILPWIPAVSYTHLDVYKRQMETLLELERNPRPWRKGLYVDPSSYAQIGGWTFDKEGQKIAQLRYLLSYGQRNHQREISRPHWPGTGGHMPPLWRTHGGHAGAGWPG